MIVDSYTLRSRIVNQINDCENSQNASEIIFNFMSIPFHYHLFITTLFTTSILRFDQICKRMHRKFFSVFSFKQFTKLEHGINLA